MALRSFLSVLTLLAFAACGRVIDDGVAPAAEVEVEVEDNSLQMVWHSETEPPPADHVYEADDDGCIRGVVWAESLTTEQVESGWCVDTLVVRAPAGHRFWMPTLEEVRGDLRILGGGAAYIRLPAIKRVYGDILVDSMARNEEYPHIATNLDLGGLRFVDKGIFISGGKLDSVNLQGLERVGTDLSAHGLRNLTSLRLPNLVTVGAELSIMDTSIETLWAPLLENASQIVAQDNPNLPQCDVEQLANESESDVSAMNNADCG